MEYFLISQLNLKKYRFILPYPTGRKTYYCTFFCFVFVCDLDLLTFCLFFLCVHFLGESWGLRLYCSFIPSIGRKVFREGEMVRYLPTVADLYRDLLLNCLCKWYLRQYKELSSILRHVIYKL